jgi:large subunit ribosomal protein L4
MQLPILNINGTETGRTITLSDEIYGIEPNNHVLYLAVKQYLANQRQGTHKSKQRNEISGSTRKLVRQKGTGGARKGSIKNPQYRGGGRIFGPQPRDYSFKINLKVNRLARRSALSYKAKDTAIKVLENFNFAAPKTKEFVKLLNTLSLTGRKTLFVLAENTPNVYLAGRNIAKNAVVTADMLNTYDIMHADVLVLCEGAVEKINAILEA